MQNRHIWEIAFLRASDNAYALHVFICYGTDKPKDAGILSYLDQVKADLISQGEEFICTAMRKLPRLIEDFELN